jgi:SNF2 family DNA or RNA helicase
MGGILADVMGLGKTLTTLALIISTLERARDFVSMVSQMRPNQGTPTSSKATMVIVPSERKYTADIT